MLLMDWRKANEERRITPRLLEDGLTSGVSLASMVELREVKIVTSRRERRGFL